MLVDRGREILVFQASGILHPARRMAGAMWVSVQAIRAFSRAKSGGLRRMDRAFGIYVRVSVLFVAHSMCLILIFLSCTKPNTAEGRQKESGPDHQYFMGLGHIRLISWHRRTEPLPACGNLLPACVNEWHSWEAGWSAYERRIADIRAWRPVASMTGCNVDRLAGLGG